MLLGNWLGALKLHRRHCSRLLSRRRRGPFPPAIEVLEDRALLSGTTILAHGFLIGDEPNIDETGPWLEELSNAIADEIARRSDGDGAVAQFRMEITDSIFGLKVSAWDYFGDFQDSNPEGPAESFDLSNSLEGEALIVLDWSAIAAVEVSQIVPQLIIEAETVTWKVADAVSDYLLNDLGIGHELLAAPLHLIGHSRGGSLIGALAEDFGEAGLWVDQTTYLDPHPILASPVSSDWGNFDFGVTKNVIFADNYWRQGQLLAPNGESVPGAHNVELDDDILEGSGYGNPIDQHADVHLWYHGTIDTVGDIDDGGVEDPFFNPDHFGWYGGQDAEGVSRGPRDGIGYHFSRAGGGSHQRPAAGLRREGAARVAVSNPPSNTDPNVWDNIEFIGSSTDWSLQQGTSLALAAFYEDLNRDATITFGFDEDANPYSDNFTTVRESVSTSTLPSHEFATVTLDTSDLSAGQTYHLYAKISNGTHTRYHYAPGKVRIEPGDADATAIDMTVALSQSTVNKGDSVTVSGRADYNNGAGAVVSGTAVIAFSGQFWTAAIRDGEYSRAITIPSSATTGPVQIFASDGRGVLGNDSTWLTVRQETPVFGTVSTSHSGGFRIVDVGDGDTDVEPIDERYVFSPTQPDGLRGILRLEDATESVRTRVEVRGPDGRLIDQWTSDFTDSFGEGTWKSWYFGWNDIPLWNDPGVYTYDWFLQPSGGSSGFTKVATSSFTYRYDFTQHIMAQDVQQSGQFGPIDPTNVFTTEDAHAYTWMKLEDISEDISVRWRWYEPNNSLYHTLECAPISTCHVIGQFAPPYESYRIWGHIDIAGQEAERKAGDWRVEVDIRDPWGNWDTHYVDSFRIIEGPNSTVSPELEIDITPSFPTDTETVEFSVTASDNTYLDSVSASWDDGTVHSITWDFDPVASSFTKRIAPGTFSAGQQIEFWATARDTSGNAVQTDRRTLTVGPEVGNTDSNGTSGDSLAQAAYDLDQALGLIANATYNWGGVKEKWLGSASGTWYFLTEDGKLYEWINSQPGANFVSGSTLVMTFDASYYEDPSNLTEAPKPTAEGGGDETGIGEVDPLALAAYEFDQALNLEENSTFNWGRANEKWFGSASGTWYFITESGSFYRWTGSSPGDLFILGSELVAIFDTSYYADPSKLFDAKLPVTGGNSEADLLAQAAYDLDQSLGLVANATYDWGGVKEKWLGSASGTWYFITEEGKLYNWTGSQPGADFVSGSTLVATLDANYYTDPSKLFDAKLTNVLDEVFSDPLEVLV